LPIYRGHRRLKKPECYWQPAQPPARLGQVDEYRQLVEHIVANPMANGRTVWLDGAFTMAPWQ
jgi:hypothetical protein